MERSLEETLEARFCVSCVVCRVLEGLLFPALAPKTHKTKMSLPLLCPIPPNPKRQGLAMRPTLRGLCRITGISNSVESRFSKYIESLTDEEKKTCWEELMKYYWDDDDAKVVELIEAHVASMGSEEAHQPGGAAAAVPRNQVVDITITNVHGLKVQHQDGTTYDIEEEYRNAGFSEEAIKCLVHGGPLPEGLSAPPSSQKKKRGSRELAGLLG